MGSFSSAEGTLAWGVNTKGADLHQSDALRLPLFENPPMDICMVNLWQETNPATLAYRVRNMQKGGGPEIIRSRDKGVCVRRNTGTCLCLYFEVKWRISKQSKGMQSKGTAQCLMPARHHVTLQAYIVLDLRQGSRCILLQ